MTHLCERMQEDLRLRNFSERPIVRSTYIVAEFAKYSHKSPDQLGPEHIVLSCCTYSTSASLRGEPFREPGSALKFLYLRTLKQTRFDRGVIKPNLCTV